jgi:lipopolysaccharide biosynthesis glycosyltransferase
MHIACAADAGYVMHSAAMLHSALTEHGACLHIHYLRDREFPSDDSRRLESMCASFGATLTFHEVEPEALTGLPIQSRFGAAMWYRTFLPELLADVARVVYLDVDTLVLSSLAPLFSIDLGAHDLAAVPNVFMEYHRDRLVDLAIEQRAYFNSGVLVLNLDAMRASDFSRRLIELVRADAGRLIWPDQDALNLVARGRWLALHPRWNSMNSFRSRPHLAEDLFGEDAARDAVRNPAIRHFEGPDSNKPWHILHSRDERRLYRLHREATPWPTYALEGATAANRVRRLLADARSWHGSTQVRGSTT